VQISKDLREFIELLNSHDVDYLLVGGHAVAFHGWPRFTEDTDFFVRPTLDNGAKLVRVLEEFGFRSPDLVPEIFTQPKKNIQLGHPPNRIDLLTWISGAEFDEAWATHDTADFDGLDVPVIGRSVLIRNKRASGRSKDLADLDHLDDE
jgi:hypothetical protein